MQTLLRDIQNGVRLMLKRPGFSFIAILTLALGIGANTALFSVVNAVLLRPLPFAESENLVMMWDSIPSLKMDDAPASAAEFIDWRNQNKSFENVAAFRTQVWQLSGSGEPERIEGARVSANLFSTIGVQPALGRAFTDEEDKPGANRSVILSNGLWKRRFGSDPNIVQKTITLNNQNYLVVGVMPQGFSFPGGANMPSGLGFSPRVEMWEPLALTNEEIAERGTHNIAVIGRMKRGVSLAQAQSDMNAISMRMKEQFPRNNKGIDIRLVSLYEQIVGDVKLSLFILLGTVGLVLLIVCANVANLLLAFATSRRKEIAIRTALGAGRKRLVRQFMTESLLIALCGGVLGSAIAFWGIDALSAFIPSSIPRAGEITVDGRIFIFTLFTSIATGLIFGIVPSMQASKTDFNESLKEGAKGVTSGGRNRTRSLLVVSQVAIAMLLLVCAGLLIRSFYRLQQVSPGFDSNNVLTMDISLPVAPPSSYEEPEQQAAFFHRALEQIKTLPGVESAAVVSSLPLSGAWESTDIRVEGYTPPSTEQQPQADYTMVSADYFRVMKIPLLRGRYFTEQDKADKPGVLIVSASLAERFFPNQNPVGKKVRAVFGEGDNEIVGVVGDIKQTTLNAETRLAVYVPYQQFPYAGYTLAIRSATKTEDLTKSVRQAINSIDAGLPVSNIRTMEQVMSTSMSERRFSMLLLCLFAALALILSAVGIYGVISYSVTQRTHEIGIRMALGAKRSDVLKMVVWQGMKLAFVGVAIGFVAAFALTRLIESMLFGVSANDSITFVIVAVLLSFVALLSCFIPARRATKVDPMIALRYE